MYTTAAEARHLAAAVLDGVGSEEGVSVDALPTFSPYLAIVGEILKGSRITLGVQNL